TSGKREKFFTISPRPRSMRGSARRGNSHDQAPESARQKTTREAGSGQPSVFAGRLFGHWRGLCVVAGMTNHNASRAGQPLPEFDPYARHKATYLDESKPVAERD